MLGVWQLVLIFAIILVLFGAGKVPQIMKDLGSGVKAFKKGFESEEDEIDLETEIKKYGRSGPQKQKVKPGKRIVNKINKGDKLNVKIARNGKPKVNKVNNVSKQSQSKKKNGKVNKKSNSN